MSCVCDLLTRLTREYQKALQSLRQYHIFKVVTVRSADAYSLTPEFATSLKEALVGADSSRPFGETASVSPEDSVSVLELDKYSQIQWENLLGYMVGPVGGVTTDQIASPPPAIIDLLTAGNLVTFSSSHGGASNPYITHEGFSFVLQDIESQLWALIFLYVGNAAAQGLDEVDILSFIFVISSSEPGLAYSSAKLNQTQRRVLTTLSMLGVVYQPKTSGNSQVEYYYPTRLAAILASEFSTTTSITDPTQGLPLTSSGNDAPRGFIIIETNFRVYAYTSSPFQIALLSLFANLRSRHPNLVVGKITRSSIQRANQRGISAQQVVSYLNSHAHPQMRAGQAQQQQGRSGQSSTLPATIVDQIHLWQLERDRMTVTHGFLLKNFGSLQEYEVACGGANDRGVLVWKSDFKRMVFVSYTDFNVLTAFIGSVNQ